MKKTLSKIVFFGSGPVAAENLRQINDLFEIEAIITKPSTEKEMRTVVDQVPVFTVTTKSELDTLIQTEHFLSTLGILIDFGIIVSQTVIDSFEKGIINSHFSLLPEWRGADPITFSILSGQEKTGVSLMLLVEAMDEGPLLGVGIEELSKDTDASTLTQSLINLSTALLRVEVPRYLSGESNGVDQQKMAALIADYPATPTYSRKTNKAEGILDFSKPAVQLEREIRAFIEWPKSRTQIATKDVVILHAEVDPSSSGTPGSVFKTDDKRIGVHTKEGALLIDKLKPAGKNAMSSEAFLAGYESKLES
jgi:methionyl-tRNA formyltransferase